MDFSKFLQWPFILEHPEDAQNPITDIQWISVRGVGFLLVVWFFWKVVIPMFFAAPLANRRKAIIDAKDQVDSTLQETEQMRNDYRQRLEKIEVEAQARMTEAVREAEDLSTHILADARVVAGGIVRRGEDEVERERGKAMVSLQKEFVEDVIGAARYAAGKSLSGAAHDSLVNDFVKRVGAAT